MVQEPPCEQGKTWGIDQDEEEADDQKPGTGRKQRAKVKAETAPRKQKVAAQTDDRNEAPKRLPPKESEEDPWEAHSQGAEWGRQAVKNRQRVVMRKEGAIIDRIDNMDPLVDATRVGAERREAARVALQQWTRGSDRRAHEGVRGRPVAGRAAGVACVHRDQHRRGQQGTASGSGERREGNSKPRPTLWAYCLVANASVLAMVIASQEMHSRINEDLMVELRLLRQSWGYGWEVKVQDSEFKQRLDECVVAVRSRHSQGSYGKGKGKGWRGYKGDFEGSKYRYGKGKNWRDRDGDSGTGSSTGRTRCDGPPAGSSADQAQPEPSSSAWRGWRPRQ